MRAILRAALVATIALATHSSAEAHPRSTSYSSWSFDDTSVEVRVRISRLDLARLGFAPALDGETASRASEYLASRLHFSSDDAPCSLAAPALLRRAPEAWAEWEWRLRCPDGARVGTIESRILQEEAPHHLHIARVARGDTVVERVLTSADSRWTFSLGAENPGLLASTGSTLGAYVRQGFDHILEGRDHIVFLLGLILLATTVGELATLVTAFTLAHSVTLALAVLGVLVPNETAVEAAIGYSIALVGAENLWILAGRDRWMPAATFTALLALAGLSLAGIGRVPVLALLGLALFTGCHLALARASRRPMRLRASIAFVFGLVHGFGFAGVLAQIGLPTTRLAPALFGFNLGVELGQLAIVAIAWPLLRGLSPRPSSNGRDPAGPSLPPHAPMVAPASAAVLAIGVYWFAARLFS